MGSFCRTDPKDVDAVANSSKMVKEVGLQQDLADSGGLKPEVVSGDGLKPEAEVIERIADALEAIARVVNPYWRPKHESYESTKLVEYLRNSKPKGQGER